MRTKDVMTWVLSVAAGAMFLLAGSLKLAGVPMEVQLFATIGLGQWFRYLTGALEIGGALLLLVPAVAAFAAALLSGVMAGAILTHVFVVGGNPAPAIALLASTVTIAWLRRDRMAAARAHLRRAGCLMYGAALRLVV